MNIPTPFSLIGMMLKWVWNKITIFWLFKTYKKSHEYKLKDLRLGSRWEKLGDDLEYSIRLANAADHESLKSKVAFRAAKGMLKNVTLFFEASGSGIRYLQKIELINLDQDLVIVHLDQIPRQDLIEASEAGIFFTINKIRFIQCIVTHIDGYLCPPFDSIPVHLSQNWLLNDKWEQRWGILWNCNAIEQAKYEISGYWRFRLGEYRHFLIYQAEHEKLSMQSQLRKLVCRFLIHPYMLTLQFWLAIHSGCFSLVDGKLIYKNQQETSVID
ncbi:TPA: hypothetical protein NHV36_006260 [Klebsiella michiganensis]|nr:hypothetical protein [Klebsiella michiganensis]MDU7881337.1 hypothetical protein [Klebsiella michiganensis]HCE8857785.1 hypothetical protein [Klebsiella michiganensis]HCE9043726.1 hypothetical protein [Klebsiella michiganensis]HCE9047217.1 hypothetical protein [Klebsiella michiganensis]